MRWVVELPAATGGTAATVTVEADSWAGALTRARGGVSVKKFRCEFEEDGVVRVHDLDSRERYTVRPLKTTVDRSSPAIVAPPPDVTLAAPGAPPAAPAPAAPAPAAPAPPPPAVEAVPPPATVAAVSARPSPVSEPPSIVVDEAESSTRPTPVPTAASSPPPPQSPEPAAVTAAPAVTAPAVTAPVVTAPVVEPAVAVATQPEPSAPTVASMPAEVNGRSTPAPASEIQTHASVPPSEPLPLATLLFERDQDPGPVNPLAYRERVFTVPPGTTASQAEQLARQALSAIRRTLASFERGRYVTVAVFDHVFVSHPDRPPLAVLRWKDWRGDAEVTFPTSLPPRPSVAPAAPAAQPVGVPPDAAAAEPAAPPVVASAAVAASQPMGDGASAVAAAASEPPADREKPVATAASSQATSTGTAGDAVTTKPGELRAQPTDRDGRNSRTGRKRKKTPPGGRSATDPGAAPVVAVSAEPVAVTPPVAAPVPPPVVAATPVVAVTPLVAVTPEPAAPPAAPSQPPAAMVQPVAAPSQPPAAKVEAPAAAPSQPPAAKVEAPAAAPSQPPAAAVETPAASVVVAASEATNVPAVEPVGSAEPVAAAAPSVTALPPSEVAPVPAATPAATATAVAPVAVDVARVSAAPPAKATAPVPRAPLPPRKRGSDLLSDLFDALMDLAFLQEAQEACEFTARTLRTHVASDAGIVLLYDIDRDELAVVAADGAASALGEREKLNQGPRGRSVLRNGPIAMDAADPVPATDIPSGPQLCVPVQHNQRLFAVVELRREPGRDAYAQDEQDAVVYVATQLGEFLSHNSRRVAIREHTSDRR